MAFEKTDGMIRHTRLDNESREYLERREELRRAEVELIRQSEKVAALRRSLPQATPVQDYCFLEGPEDLDAGDAVRPVRLSELFSTPTRRPLIIYHFMYGKKQTLPCPMCTMMIDGFNGVASHLSQNVDFAIVAAAQPAALRAHARARGWRRLRLLSAADSTFKYRSAQRGRRGAPGLGDLRIHARRRRHGAALLHQPSLARGRHARAG